MLSMENMQPVSSAEKHTTYNLCQCGKTYNQCQARENIQPTSNAGKHKTSFKRGKTCNPRQTRNNIKPAKRRKNKTSVKRGKTYNWCYTSGQRSFYYRTVTLWNTLKPHFKLIESLIIFKRKMKAFLLNQLLMS